MTTGERIAARRHELGLSQTELARLAGIKQPTIAKLERDMQSGSPHMHKIARALQTTAAYLIGEIDDPSENAFIPPTPAEIAAEMGLIKVEEIDLTIGMGAAFLDEHVTSVERWIPEDWVRNFTNSPAALLSIARPVGDSMYPTINDRDLVLIDRSQRAIDRVDGIWALVFGGFGTIKRVRVLPDGRHKLMADNPQVEAEMATDGELFVIGRVAGVFRRT
jgi:phage repressor protein C with HTH and peptisase S24 domain